MKKFIKRITDVFAVFFGKEFKFLKANSAAAVKITEALKNIVESPLARIVVNVIPGELDNMLFDKAQKIVPVIAAKVAIAHGIIQAGSSNAAVLASIIAELQKRNKDARVGFWLEFSARLNQALSDGKMTLAEAAALAQLAYVELYENKSK